SAGVMMCASTSRIVCIAPPFMTIEPWPLAVNVWASAIATRSAYPLTGLVSNATYVTTYRGTLRTWRVTRRISTTFCTLTTTVIHGRNGGSRAVPQLLWMDTQPAPTTPLGLTVRGCE